ncbi:hypothetical protein C8J57DRAFT_1554422 [Mycena rebaudengoi]|nr:hypothetical protein C8J57DRAFT_1554422 [Mycena rebaudengoi]
MTFVPPDDEWPVLLFFNGLGGYRLVAAFIEGIAHEHSVQMLTLDKPGSGGSSPNTPMHTALLAVLAHHHITRFAALSHSNGLFYALHTLLNLPPSITVWTISGPFVPPSISSSVGLRLAAALPASLPNTLGTLLGVVPPANRLFSWSAGLLAAGGAAEEPEAKELRKPPHKRRYGARRRVVPAGRRGGDFGASAVLILSRRGLFCIPQDRIYHAISTEKQRVGPPRTSFASKTTKKLEYPRKNDEEDFGTKKILEGFLSWLQVTY